MNSGIYKITCTANNKFYIGSSVRIEARWRSHLNLLRRAKHCNHYLQNTYNKYGENNLEFSILEICAKSKTLLHTREQYYFELLKPDYNLAPIAGSCLGYKHSVASRKKLSKARAKPVLQLDIRTGVVIQRWASTREASLALKLHPPTITGACQGKRYSAGGFLWQYENNPQKQLEYRLKHRKRTKGIYKLDKITGEILAEYPTITEASVAHGVGKSAIAKASKGLGTLGKKFIWRYAE